MAGLSVTAFASSIEHGLGVAAWVVAASGIAAVAWGATLGALAGRTSWRRSVPIAVAGNLLLATLLAMWAMSQTGPGTWILAIAALQVAAFGAVQGWALVEA